MSQCYPGSLVSMSYLNLLLLNAKIILKERIDHIEVIYFWDGCSMKVEVASEIFE